MPTPDPRSTPPTDARLTGNGDADLRRIAAQYEELDRAFGVPEQGAPVNGTPQRPKTPLERALDLDHAAAELVNTANLGRLEELTTALEVLYGPGVGYPFRDAIGELGHKLSTARANMAQARRLIAEEVHRLEAACDQWADDYRRVEDAANQRLTALQAEAARRQRAEEVLRRLEELPHFLDDSWDGDYTIAADHRQALRRLINAHTAAIAGVPGDTGPQPGPGPSLRHIITELNNRLDDTHHGFRLDVAHWCRMLLDSIPADELDRRPGA